MSTDVLRNQIKCSNMMKTNIYEEDYQIWSIDWMPEDNTFVIIIKKKDRGMFKEYTYRNLPSWIRKWMFTDKLTNYYHFNKIPVIGIF